MTPYEKHYMLGLIVAATVGAFLVAFYVSWRLKRLSKRAELASSAAAILMLLIGLALVHYAPPHPAGHKSSAWADGLSSSWTPFSIAACLASKAAVDKASRHEMVLILACTWFLLAIAMSSISVQVANGH